MSAISHRRHRFPPVEFADHLEAWGAASLFGGFKLRRPRQYRANGR
jgi:hypothetical protein